MPPDYCCDTCGKTGVKLWIELHPTENNLKCEACLATAEGRKYFVPAIPLANGEGWYGENAAPKALRAWWSGLPTDVPRQLALFR
jgi:hypothetical protein